MSLLNAPVDRRGAGNMGLGFMGLGFGVLVFRAKRVSGPGVRV